MEINHPASDRGSRIFMETPHIIQCEAPKIATVSWFITPITMVSGTYNYRYWGL